ncbi:hypothetical protein M422DRAFT_247747 [Sphaerobolus stellatus SS14]|nr:hypothetical protein M422DRAFT_247747 [Sphaerobolus stellatus SS14]
MEGRWVDWHHKTPASPNVQVAAIRPDEAFISSEVDPEELGGLRRTRSGDSLLRLQKINYVVSDGFKWQILSSSRQEEWKMLNKLLFSFVVMLDRSYANNSIVVSLLTSPFASTNLTYICLTAVVSLPPTNQSTHTRQ